MMDEQEFRKATSTALDALLQHLIAREEDEEAGFEVEGGQGGLINVLFEQPPGKFVITPNAPIQQIWISALSTRSKLDENAPPNSFFLPKNGEQLIPLVDRLIPDHRAG